jgi:MYXO-CTERM domain-containing protein
MIRTSFLAFTVAVLSPLAAHAEPDLGPVIPCNGVPPQGCCDGETLKYCISGTLKTRDCSGEPKCGWSAKDSYYYCGTAGGEDNKYPKACPAQPPDSGAAADSGPDSGSTEEKSDGGCSFTAGSGSDPSRGFPLVLLALLLLPRRRR